MQCSYRKKVVHPFRPLTELAWSPLPFKFPVTLLVLNGNVEMGMSIAYSKRHRRRVSLYERLL